MKLLVSALACSVAAMALGCAAEADYDPREEPSEELAEYDSIEQPIYMPEGYGADMNQNRCGDPFAGGRCRVPDRRDWIFEWPAESVGLGAQRGCSDEIMRRGMETAAKNISSVLNAQGWNTTARVAVSSAGAAQIVGLVCNNGPTSGTVAALTTIPSTCVQSETDCHSTPRGELFQYGRAAVTVFPNRIKNLPSIPGGWNSLTASQKRILVTNIVTHEYGHVAGLGHASESTSPLMGFGSNGASSGLNTTLQLTADEKSWIKCYNESSSTTARC